MPSQCFLDIEIVFDGVPTKMMKWAMRKEGLSEVIVGAVMKEVRVGSEISKEFWMKVNVKFIVCFSQLPLICTVAMDIITKYAREGMMKEICTQMPWF